MPPVFDRDVAAQFEDDATRAKWAIVRDVNSPLD
jgi:hypothetical protein